MALTAGRLLTHFVSTTSDRWQINHICYSKDMGHSVSLAVRGTQLTFVLLDNVHVRHNAINRQAYRL